MQWTIKRIKSRKSATDKAFTLYLDGEHVARIVDSGPENEYQFNWVKPEAEQTLNEFVEQLPKYECFEQLVGQTPDIFIRDLIEVQENRAWFVKRCHKRTLFRLRGEKPKTWRELRRQFSPKVKAALLKKYEGKVEIIANEMI